MGIGLTWHTGAFFCCPVSDGKKALVWALV